MTDTFEADRIQLHSPATGAFEVTPAADALARVTRSVYVGGAGNLNVIMEDDGATVPFQDVPAGSLLPIRVTHILSTGTTATKIVGLY